VNDHSESKISGRLVHSGVMKVLSCTNVPYALHLAGWHGPVSFLGEIARSCCMASSSDSKGELGTVDQEDLRENHLEKLLLFL